MPGALPGAMPDRCSEQSTQRTQQTQRNVRHQDLTKNPLVPDTRTPVDNGKSVSEQQRMEPRMTQISIIGNITSPAELRFTQTGKAVASVTVAVNRKRGEVEETDFHRVTAWEGMAENIAALEKGTRVLVIGRLTSKPYETREGEKRTGWDITADAFGPDLRFATVQVTRAASQARPQQSDDTWATAQPAAATAATYGDDTPF